MVGVAAHFAPPVVAVVFQCVPHAFFGDRLPDQLAGTLRELVVEPVVTESNTHCHLGSIEAVLRVPVGEAADGQHVSFHLSGVAFIARHAVGVREVEGALPHLSRYFQHVRALQFSLQVGALQQDVALPEDQVVHLLPFRMARDHLLDARFLSFEKQQTRMRMVQQWDVGRSGR